MSQFGDLGRSSNLVSLSKSIVEIAVEMPQTKVITRKVGRNLLNLME